MLKMHTVRPMAIALVGAAAILMIALGVASYLRIAPSAPSPLIPAVNPVSPSIHSAAPVSVSANLAAARSVYISEQTLRNRLDVAYERHQTARVQTLLRILNGRYERRCHLPY